MKLFRILFILPLCLACGSNEPAAAEDADELTTPTMADAGGAKDAAPGGKVMTKDEVAGLPNACSGKVKGFGLDVVDTVFVEGFVDMGTKAPVLVVVQSSVADACTHLQNGTYPKHGVFFPMALIQADAKPVAAGRAYKPSNPDDATTDDYFVFAQLRAFDQACNIQPDAEYGMAVLGRLVMDTYVKGEHVAGRFSFKMGPDRDAVAGSFNAAFCDAPNLFADYMTLLNPQIDSAHCL